MLCNHCKKKEATRNYQKIWVMWKILKENSKRKGNYGYSKTPKLKLDISEPIGDENLHLCDDCGEVFEHGPTPIPGIIP